MYSSYVDVPQETFAEVLLRTGKLAEAQTEGQTPFPATEGKCTDKALSRDTTTTPRNTRYQNFIVFLYLSNKSLVSHLL